MTTEHFLIGMLTLAGAFLSAYCWHLKGINDELEQTISAARALLIFNNMEENK